MRSDFILNCSPEFNLKEDESSTLIKQYFYSRFGHVRQTFSSMRKPSEKEFQLDFIKRIRKSRKVKVLYVQWDQPVPKSFPISESDLALFDQKIVSKIKECFQLRPIWSRFALLCVCQCTPLMLRLILPAFSFSFENGPFRNLWVSYGYDPREDPKSKIYQLLDTRIFISPNSIDRSNQMNSNEIQTDWIKQSNETKKFDENGYKFRLESLSSIRRTNFQLCDIELEEVQQILHENDGKESEFTEKDGWLERGTIDRIRSIMNRIISELVVKNPFLSENACEQDIEYEDIEVSQVFDDPFFDCIENENECET